MNMKYRILSFVLPVALLVGVLSISSCKKSREVKAIITVLHDTITLNLADTTYDTITGPVTGAQVRMYSDQIGSLIDTTIMTNSSGQAEFEFENVAILLLEVTHFAQQLDLGYVILEEGEVVEKTVNLDDP